MTCAARQTCLDLADDLGWLEQHARKHHELAERAIALRFAAALVRNVVSPYLHGSSVPPLHVAVVGGAGTGKSTVANLLCGVVVAEANPQAGFTRHPVAYAHSGAMEELHQDSFLGPLKLPAAPLPSSVDEDLYQVRSLTDNEDTELLNRFVVWDCPDMTTWAASGYAPRLLEVAALADAIVFVASDERYNDAVPTQYLKLFLEAGKAVVCVLTKMRPEIATELCEHFQTQVLAKLPRGRVTVLAVPHLSADELADPVRLAGRYRISLINQMNVIGDPPAQLRRQAVTSAVTFLQSSLGELLAVAQNDLTALDAWARLVRDGQEEFEDRYRREFLVGAKFQRFDEALVRLIDLLELPGVGKGVASALYVIRTPYRLLKGFLGKMLGTPEAPPIPEQPVLESAYSAWVDHLRATALANAKDHSLWRRVANGFNNELSQQLRTKFDESLRDFQAGERDEIDRTARAIYEDLEKSPNTLAALRSGKLALDIGAIVGSLAMGGLTPWDVVWVPAAAAVSQQLVEWAGAGYVELQRDQARQRQRELVTNYLARPLGDWLVQWPETGGTEYERLRLALNRIPTSLAAASAAVQAKA